MPHSTSNHHPHHVHPTAFYHKSQYSPTAFSFPPLVPHPHKVLKSPYSPTASSFPPLVPLHKPRPHSPTGSSFPAISASPARPPPLTNIQTFDLLNVVDQLTKECEEVKTLGKVHETERKNTGSRDEEAGSLDDEILECQLAILNTQMQLSQVLTQTLELDFEIREKEVKIAQKTRSCKLKRRVLARLGKKLEGAKGDALRDKKVIEPVSGKAASEQMTQKSGFQRYQITLLATVVLSAMMAKPDYIVAVLHPLYACVFS